MESIASRRLRSEEMRLTFQDDELVRRIRRDLHADHPARASAVVDDDLLVPAFRKLLAERARQQIRRAAGRKRHNEPQRAVRVVLRNRRQTSRSGD